MSSQTAVALKGRNRPTRQAAAQHRYADMKVETNGYVFEEQVMPTIGLWQRLSLCIFLDSLCLNDIIYTY
jgi:hypothetical protein